MNPEPNTQWRLGTKYLVSIGLAIFALFVIYLMRPVLPLLVLASLIALVASPSIHFLYQRLKIPRESSGGDYLPAGLDLNPAHPVYLASTNCQCSQLRCESRLCKIGRQYPAVGGDHLDPAERQ